MRQKKLSATNLKGTDNHLRYYRLEETGDFKPVRRVRKGQEQQYLEPILNRVYFEKEVVSRFSLENTGQPLPRVNGNITVLDNYFLDYWGHFLGAGPTTAFAHLLRYCYGKDYCWPKLETIAAKMNCSLPTLRNYYDILEQYGFAYRFWCENVETGKDDSILFKVRKTIPFLSEELIEKLPKALRKEHDEYVEDLMESYDVMFEDSYDYPELYDSLKEKGSVSVSRVKLNVEDRETFYQLKYKMIHDSMTERERELWEHTLAWFKRSSTAISYSVYLSRTLGVRKGSTLYIYADSKPAADMIASKYKERVLDGYNSLNGEECTEIICESLLKEYEEQNGE